MKSYLENRQSYHSPVQQSQNRFYMVKIARVEQISDVLKKSAKPKQQNPSSMRPSKQSRTGEQTQPSQQKQRLQFKISFDIGTRTSSTTIQITKQQSVQNNAKRSQSLKKNQKNKKPQPLLNQYQQFIKYANQVIKFYQFNDVHIFPFQKEEVMSIRFQNVHDTQEYGYALVPLIPFVKLPYTRHEVEVDMVFQTSKKQIRKDLAVVLNIQLYFLHHFKARLLLEPIQADLGRNLAEIGQMTPILKFFIRNYQFSTQALEQGGIKPYWQSRKDGQYCLFNIPLESVLDNLFLYIFNQSELTLDSMIGYNPINLQQQGIFKNGQPQNKFIEQVKSKFRNKVKEAKLTQKFRQQEQRIKRTQQQHGSDKQTQRKKKALRIRLATQQKQFCYIYKKIRQYRQVLYEYTIKNIKILNSDSPPQVLNQLAQRIYKQYTQSDHEKHRSQVKEAEDIMQPEQRRLFLEQSRSTLTLYQLRQQIQKALKEQMWQLIKFIKEQMDIIQVPLYFRPKNLIGEPQRQKQIGKISFRYLFLYQFDSEGLNNKNSQVNQKK